MLLYCVLWFTGELSFGMAEVWFGLEGGREIIWF